MGYQTRICCIHYADGRCAHPYGRRLLFANRHCIIGPWATDPRVGSCRVHVEPPQPAVPPPPPMPRSGPVPAA